MSKKKHKKYSKQPISKTVAYMEQSLESTTSSSDIVHDQLTKVIYPSLADLVKRNLNQQMADKAAELNSQENKALISDISIRKHIEVEICNKASNETYYVSNHVELNDETFASLLRSQRNEVVSRAYLFLLGRMPDYEGLSHYQGLLAERKPILSIIGDIASSPESKISTRNFLDNQYFDYLALKFQSSLFLSIPAKIFCTIRKSHLREIINADNFIDNTYQYVLNRSPDSSGARHYTNSIKSGKSKLDVLLEIYSSEEALSVRPKIAGINWFLGVKKICEFLPIKVIIDLLKMPSRVHSLLINERSNSVQLNELNNTLLNQNEEIATVIRQIERHKQEFGNNLNSISDQLKLELNQMATNSESRLISLDQSAEQRSQSILEHHATTVLTLDSVAEQLKAELTQMATNSESRLISLDQSAEQRFQSILEHHATTVLTLDSVAEQLKAELTQMATNSESRLISLDQSAEQRFQSILEHHATTVLTLDSVAEQLKAELTQMATNSESRLISLDQSAEQRSQSILEHHATTVLTLDSVAEQLKAELTQMATNSESRLISLDQSAEQLNGNLRELTNFAETEKFVLDAYVNFLKSKIDVLEQYTYASARRVAINLGNGELLLKTGSGYLLCDQSDSALIACLIDTGELEYGTRIFIQSFLRESDVFIDVGANVGIHTLVGARTVGQTGKVYAIEAFGRTAELLKKSIYLNSLSSIAQVYNFAASNTKGKGVLHFGETSGHHSIYSLNIEGKGSEAVELNLLDNIIQADQKIALLKIDVEGAEIDVIKGAKKLIDANRNMALIIEYGPSHIHRVGINPIDWFAVIDSLNYLIFVINENTGGLERLDMIDIDKVESVNLFCINAKSEYLDRIQLPI